jgi:hypothetical protein
MEALSVIVNSKIVADDTRRCVAGDLPFERPRRHPWRALRRKLSRPAIPVQQRAEVPAQQGAEVAAQQGAEVAAQQGAGRPRLVAQSSGD